MNKTIKTYSDLCEERERMKNVLVVQKQRMRDDWEGLKDEFLPVKKVFGMVSKFSSPNKQTNPLMNKGVRVALNLFLTKFVLGKAGWVTKLAVPFVLSNYSTHVIADKGQNFISKVADFLNSKKKFGVKQQPTRNFDEVTRQQPLADHTFGGNTINPNIQPGPASGTYTSGEA